MTMSLRRLQRSKRSLVKASCILVACALVDAAPAMASRASTGNANAASTPPRGVPVVVWNGDFFSTGFPGALTAPRQLLPAPGGASVDMAIDPAGDRTVFAAERELSSGPMFSGGVFFGISDASGRVRFRRVLPGGDSLHLPLVAGSSAGDALLAWNTGSATVVARMAPGGPLRPPVSAGSFSLHDAAIDGNGTATVAGYRPGGHVLVSTAKRGGRFSKPIALPPSSAIARVASGSGGQTAVVTRNQADGLQLFYRPRPGASFGPADNIAGPTALAIVSTAVDAQGRVLVAWTESAPNQRVRFHVTVTDEAGHPTEDTALSDPNRDLSHGDAAAAMNDQGDVAAAWEEAAPGSQSAPAGSPHIYASVRPAGGHFAPAQQVTPVGRQAAPVVQSAIAVGSDGRAVVVWADTTEGTELDQRFMTARLDASGLSDVTRLDTTSPAPADQPTAPVLLSATLAVGAVQRVSPSTGRLDPVVRCTSWTFEPCRGRIAIKDRRSHPLTSSRRIRVGPGSASAFTVHLARRARRMLKRGRTIRATVVVTLQGASVRGARKSIVIRPR
jgi:hypothetical protein